MLNENSITGLMALNLIIPLSAGVFDLSIGYSLGLCNVLVAHLIVDGDMSPWLAIALTLLAALGIGLLNAIVVVIFKIDSLIATLATGSLLLAGIPVNRLRFLSLIVSAVVAGGIAGICVTSQIAAGSATAGPPYLLNAFAAAFLGATQLRQGRFNPWGTLIAVLLLGAGTTGLALAKEQWVRARSGPRRSSGPGCRGTFSRRS